MPPQLDSLPAFANPCRRFAWLIPAMIAAGFVLTLQVFYPGVMTYDSKYMYIDIESGHRGDWQSPVRTELWKLIDWVAPGPASVAP